MQGKGLLNRIIHDSGAKPRKGMGFPLLRDDAVLRSRPLGATKTIFNLRMHIFFLYLQLVHIFVFFFLFLHLIESCSKFS